MQIIDSVVVGQLPLERYNHVVLKKEQISYSVLLKILGISLIYLSKTIHCNQFWTFILTIISIRRFLIVKRIKIPLYLHDG